MDDKKKFELLFRAVSHENALFDELKAAAFEALLHHPGSSFEDWRRILLEQYGSEVIDALGPSPQEIINGITDLWETPYTDNLSGATYTLAQWADVFKTKETVLTYYKITSHRRRQ